MVAIIRFGGPLVLAAAAAALAMPRLGGDDCCQKTGALAKDELGARVSKAVAGWRALPERMQALSADERAQLKAAQAVTDRICPVCKEMPATLAFLQEAFHAGAALDAKLLESCHGAAAKGDSAGECPFAAAGKDVASGKQAPALALELISVAIASVKPAADCCAAGTAAKKDDCCAAGGSDDCCAAKKSDGGDALVLAKGLAERAAKLEATWTTSVPAALAALPAADKADLDKALATHKKLNPRMAAMLETMHLLRELAAADGCCASGGATDAHANVQLMAELMAARAELKKQALAILTAMGKVCGEPGSSCCEKDKAAAAN
ncbi:MAG: hypothetical protein U1E76_15355 [Planctomycetota bacterium]